MKFISLLSAGLLLSVVISTSSQARTLGELEQHANELDEHLTEFIEEAHEFIDEAEALKQQIEEQKQLLQMRQREKPQQSQSYQTRRGKTPQPREDQRQNQQRPQQQNLSNVFGDILHGVVGELQEKHGERINRELNKAISKGQSYRQQQVSPQEETYFEDEYERSPYQQY